MTVAESLNKSLKPRAMVRMPSLVQWLAALLAICFFIYLASDSVPFFYRLIKADVQGTTRPANDFPVFYAGAELILSHDRSQT